MKARIGHKTVYLFALDAEIDELVAPLVVALNRFPVLKTIASCQGEPGPIREGGAYGFVDFVYGCSWLAGCRFCFGGPAPALRDMYDDVVIGVWQTDAAPPLYCSFKVACEAIPAATAVVEKLHAAIYRSRR